MIGAVGENSECIHHMWWSMTNRAIGWCVMRYLRKGQIKWTRLLFVKGRSGYRFFCFFFKNEISSSLLFLKCLTVTWRDSEPYHPPVKGTSLHLMVKVEAETEKEGKNTKESEQNLKGRGTTNPRHPWDSLIPLRAMCDFVCVCACSSKKHQTYRQSSCLSDFTIIHVPVYSRATTGGKEK